MDNGFRFLYYYLPILANEKGIYKIRQTAILSMQKNFN